MAEPTTRHLTILLTDIKGFTDKTSSKTRAAISTMLDEHRAVVLPLLEARGGRLIKTIGDAFLMTFESPTNAVLAGVSVQEALAKRNEGRAADDRLEIRIAINAGEVNLMENDVFGEAVNITARIEGIAEAGQVYFTEAVYLAMNKAEVPSSEIGLMQLKGIPEKIRVYKVRREEPVGAASAPASPTSLFGLLARPAAPKGPLVGGAVPLMSRRAGAVLLDWMFCAMLLEAVSGGTHALILKGWGFAVAWIVYQLVFLSRMDATPGKRLLKLRVVSTRGGPLEKRQREIRALVSLVSGYAAGLGYLWAFWEPQQRAWHDLMADTRVVVVPD